MTKRKSTKKPFNKTESGILKSLNEAVRWAKGEDVPGVRVTHYHAPEKLDVKAIRSRLGMSQIEFANSFGFSASTLRNWEQGTRKPETTARILLTIIGRAPGIVQSVLDERRV